MKLHRRDEQTFNALYKNRRGSHWRRRSGKNPNPDTFTFARAGNGTSFQADVDEPEEETGFRIIGGGR